MVIAAVLAAGKGTRMYADMPKVLYPLAGKPMLGRVLDTVRQAGIQKSIVIIGYKGELIRNALADAPDLEFVEQQPQLGTGHAIQQLLPILTDYEGDIVVLNGDSPLFSARSIQDLIRIHQERQVSATILTALMPDPTGYGRVFCNSQLEVESIIEHKDCTPAQLRNQRVSTGAYCFRWRDLAEVLPRLDNQNAQGEYYLTAVFGMMGSVIAHDLADWRESMGINDRYQLAQAYAFLQEQIRYKWMKAGVTMILPETITIEETVELAPNVTIEPQTHLRGKTVIKTGSVIGPNSLIENSIIHEHCTVMYSVVTDSEIQAQSRIGPYAHIRHQSLVGAQCRIGNFVELKKTTIGQQTNAAHLSYLGDATIGSKVNIGAGTITANYDGFRKHHTVIGDRTKTGSNSVLCAPVTIGANVNIGAGSVITEDVPDNSLAIARARQVTKPDYYDHEGKKKQTAP
ncbi:MAG: bifunctional UDP-N-acetylglucosamine diphosphorylase/glucosamine-1-phosphate N-acetyltransferase GlmU [Pseudanabaenaceae cyanobacterium]